MDGKKKVQKKNAAEIAQLKEALRTYVKPRYGIDISPDEHQFKVASRADFIDWLDKTYSRYQTSTQKQQDCTKSNKETQALELFEHQKFIKDYLQYHSPYRGLLLYHGIGVGKSCSSIAAAEVLSNDMQVVIMLPASLRDNYIGEIKKCGTLFYGVNEHHWTFYSEDLVDSDVLKIARLDAALVKKNKGIWVPNLIQHASNWKDLSQTNREAIMSQIDLMIHKSVRFINYNGLNRKSIEALVEDGKNPFDNKCVVIDEIHNLVSVISNGGLIGSALYKLLMQAQNMKLVLLSGTPVINYPHEIAFMINLITGPRTTYECKISKDAPIDKTSLDKFLESHEHVDIFDVDVNNKKITLSLLPVGFKKLKNGKVTRDARRKEDDINVIVDELSSLVKINKKYTIHKLQTLPEKEDEFNKYFVNFSSNSVANKVMFMRRIIGTVSYYSTYSPELYPTVNVSEVPLEMVDSQFNLYEKARGEERKKEKSSTTKGRKKTETIFNSSGQVYRFYSRAVCNFAFPEEIERPFPSKLSQMSKELDEMDAEILEKEDLKSKSEITKYYMAALNAAVDKLISSGSLDISEIHKYSPKFKAIYDAIMSVNGTSLAYSQFRKVEGLGLFAEFLKYNGWAEFKIERVKDEWVLDIAEEDMNKPKYISFTGSNETARTLLDIFNGLNIPPAIAKQLGISASDRSPNLRGQLIKLLMITKSGSEGISLKNVRQVHAIEPYWNHIRTDQVIGRAVRTCSHADLPADERNVNVYVYYMKASKKQIKNSFSIRTQDKSMTSDEYIFDLAKRKAKIINEFLSCMQKASVDCALNAKKHGSMKCFSYPININPKSIVFKPEIAFDIQDDQYYAEVETNEWKGRVFKTTKGNFLVRPDTSEVYDYDMYVYSGRLSKLGDLNKEP